ncbi:hypothetical protein Fot_38027 [Forsythia ovata]|uniref:Uncharacterized protein n=1 Tax=Forsythia ovata TaxID=205694 RepID=A0ABD1S0M1_9LAMI
MDMVESLVDGHIFWIERTGLAANKILQVMKEKSDDHDQKRTFAGLSLKGGEKEQHNAPTSSDLRQTTLVPNISSQGLQLMVQKQELGGAEASEVHEEVEPSAPEGESYDHLLHIKKILEGKQTDIGSEEEANEQKKILVDKVVELENALDFLKAECSSLKEANLKLIEGTEDAAFFVNFGTRQVLSELKELHPNLDLSTIEADYLAIEEAEDVVDQPPADGT